MAPREAAEHLGCTKQHLQMLRPGGLDHPLSKLAALIRYAREDLNSYLSKRNVETKFCPPGSAWVKDVESGHWLMVPVSGWKNLVILCCTSTSSPKGFHKDRLPDPRS